ncbi:hypothetical protein [Paenibacillus senegalimassiliensis]|uniref:hypothetical protein n=1 Tax=Paenibacillus senegalimassiliensis TaxID=1737426 RepID=UPI00073F8556|nr:hypothetical protein [Paenibacillus senegalimassiliensis]
MMELYRLRFKTGNKTVEDIKSMYDTSAPEEEILEQTAEAYRSLNGMEVVGAEWNYSPDTYSIYGWKPEDDEKMKEFTYLIEQDEMFGSYLNRREDFEKDWKNGEYESSAALHFDKGDFEVIEKIERE